MAKTKEQPIIYELTNEQWLMGKLNDLIYKLRTKKLSEEQIRKIEQFIRAVG
jgi:hypothetical protein